MLLRFSASPGNNGAAGTGAGKHVCAVGKGVVGADGGGTGSGGVGINGVEQELPRGAAVCWVGVAAGQAKDTDAAQDEGVHRCRQVVAGGDAGSGHGAIAGYLRQCGG